MLVAAGILTTADFVQDGRNWFVEYVAANPLR